MRPSQRHIAHLLLAAAFVPLSACASTSGGARSDDPVFEEGDRAPRDDDEDERIARERAERDRIERNTPSREIDGAAYPAGWGRRSEGPDVRVWIENGESVYRPGDRVRALFRLDDDAYVTVVRVDTDGRMRVLFPRSPRESAWVRGEHSYRVPGSSAGSFVVDDPTGLGYVFAITSYERFDYSRVAYGREWDYEAIGYRVSGDPFLAVRRFADRISLDDRAGYATAYDEYYVGRHVEYPRYTCYDCHAAGSYPVHDPYGHACPRVRVVVYSDPYYYPYRHYPGTRVVYAARPRYVFKEGGTSTPTSGGPRGGGSTGTTGGTLVEHRRRDGDVDLRRPGSPTSDPNIQPRVAENPGATRPGDDIQSTVQGGRRRVEEPTTTPVIAPREGLGTPRRDAESTPSTGNGGNGNGGGNAGGAAEGVSRPGPRRDPGGESSSAPENPPSRADDARPEQRRRAGDEPRGYDPRRDEPRNDGGNASGDGRRGSSPDVVTPATTDRRDDRSESRQGDGEDRRGAPEFHPPRDDGPRSDSPRYESRRSASGGESGGARRSEPRVEARGERRSEPRSETKSEPKTERRSEPKSQPRSETKTESKQSGGSTGSRRRPD